MKAQVVFNSGFENWTGNTPNQWIGSQTNIVSDSIIPYSTNVHSGLKACRLINSKSLPKKFSTTAFTIEAGKKYFISYWVRGAGNILSVSLYTGTGTNLPTLVADIDTLGWVKKEALFEATTSSTMAELVFSVRQTNWSKDDIQIDDILIYSTNFSENLDINNISAKVSADGSLFNNKFEAPKGSGVNSIYENNIWIGGYDANSQLHLAAQTYTSSGVDFSFGPIATNTEDINFFLKYQRVWKIDKTTIQNHIANYSTTNYIVPPSILQWPANGDQSNGEAPFLAPFVDLNFNGIYEPENGDYPKIRGDQAIFFMFNDDKLLHNSGGDKMKIEVHGLAYSFNNTNDSALNQTVFVNYEIFNRSSNNYHDVYFGSFTDMDLGNGMDDYIGCDSTLNMFYTFNSSISDGTGTSGQYGSPAPAQGAMFLNHPISRFLYFNNGNTFIGEPQGAIGFYNYLIGKWNDGSPMTYGGIGYNGTIPTNFMFPGTPEAGLNDWNECNLGNQPGDRRGVMSVGPFSVNAGEMFCVDLAFPFARDYFGTNLSAIALLRERSQSIQTFYNQQNFICEMPHVGVTENQPNALINIFPNPNNGSFYVNIPNNTKNLKIEIYSIMGQLIYSKQLNSEKTSLNFELSKGVFMFIIKDENGDIFNNGKIIVN